jgi:hypothetical protein
LYLPASVDTSEDLIYAQALGIPDQFMQVRELMYRGEGAPVGLLELIAERLGVDRERVVAFAGQPFETLYREGVCGGAILPLGSVGAPRPEVQVPLAHQSALAGILLAARMVSHAAGDNSRNRQITRVNVMHTINAKYLSQEAAKDPRGICVCQDRDYRAAFRAKY